MIKNIIFLLITGFLMTSCAKNHMSVSQDDKKGIMNDSISQYFPPDSVFPGKNFDFQFLCIDNKNNKWIVGGAGIFRFDGKNWTYFNSTNTSIDFKHWYASSILSDNNGIIYAPGAVGAGLAVYQDNNWNLYRVPFVSYTMHIDPITNSIYFLANLNGEPGVYKFTGNRDFSDLANYTFIDPGLKKGISDVTVYNDKIYFMGSGGIGNLADTNTAGILVRETNGAGNYYPYPAFTNLDSLQYFLDPATTNGNDLVMLEHYTINNVVPSLFYFYGAKWTAVPIPYGAGITPSPDLPRYGKDGTLWIVNNAYPYSLLIKYFNNVFTFYQMKIDSDFNQAGIGDLAIDDTGIKWFVSTNSGLISFKETH